MEKVVFYDGECGLCQRSVRILAELDTRHELLFAPLNGETYFKFFKNKSELTTVIFYSAGKVWTKSDAAIEAIHSLSGWKRLIVLLKIIPRFLRDLIYSFIAGHRKKVSCVILVKDERFLK